MTLFAAAGLAGALFVTSQTGAPPPVPADPLLAPLLVDPGNDVAKLHAEVRREPHDPAWANKAEIDLADRYAMFGAVHRLRIQCGATLCEVAAVLDDGDRSRFDRTLADLQDAKVLGLERYGLRSRLFAIGGHAAGGVPIVTYVTRGALSAA